MRDVSVLLRTQYLLLAFFTTTEWILLHWQTADTVTDKTNHGGPWQTPEQKDTAIVRNNWNALGMSQAANQEIVASF
ncbi:uncharacterized protein RSE6_08266 [Rhynchosporium secalis]|uniref:Uncharacterized protein n=1 Tax=Rhynchosporium secalis TaxID=38038 RepID=A0A1E1MF28_RHYSE|nr:uncharacterized protein RSE6_08266 [Rhynchosporium secalis]